jgi:hypothetical protein
MSKRIEFGRASGKPVYLDLMTLLRTRALIQANSGGGKSWLLRLLAEQLFGKVPVWIVDPEGEFPSLREKFGYVLVGKGGETPADPRSVELVVHRLLEHGASAIFDLYDLKPQARHHYVRLLCEALMNAPKALWRNLIFKLDEAHKFAPEKGQGESEASGAVTDVATAGRKRGFCLMAYTQRLSKITKNVTAELLNRMVGMTFEDLDVDSAAAVLSVSKPDRDDFKLQIKHLEPGSFFGLGPAISRDRLLLQVGRVQTTHPEPGTTAAAAPPPAPEKIRALLPKLADLPKEAEEKAKSEADLRHEIRSLKAQLSARPVAALPKPAPVSKNDERIVEVPVMGKRDMNRLEKLVTRVEEAKKAYWGTTTSLENATRDISALLERLKDGTSTNELRKSVGLPPVKEKGIAKLMPRPTIQHFNVEAGKHVAAASGKTLDKCARAILVVLAQYDGGCSIGKISLLAGYRQSGSFMSALSSLRTQGYLIGNNSEYMRITPAGIAELGDFTPLPAGADLAQYWLQHPSFDLCSRKILGQLVATPEGLLIDDLADRTGYSQSGSFMSALSALRTAGVLVGKNSERMLAAPDLY